MLGRPYVRMKASDLADFANNEGGYRIGVIEIDDFGTGEVMARYSYGGDKVRGGMTIPVKLASLFADQIYPPFGVDQSRPTAIIDEQELFPFPEHDAIHLADWDDADKYRGQAVR